MSELPHYLSTFVLRLTSTLLRLPARATIAAASYWHYYKQHRCLIPQQDLLPDHVPVSNNHLLNVVLILHQLLTQGHLTPAQLLATTDPSPAMATPESAHQAAPPVSCLQLSQLVSASSSVLVGQAYYDAKASMLSAEQQIG
ncbi:hypothetical protein HaLaN_15090 [Haematococcus lacustris]|uniref:Uncharacterized protein n=1 Tax=Haematococcus lacustris TaxID=44745 RepID=A0A699Z6U5_HAELA|nr:hypothetical protein HaLaN_15090 [Haematococcus lacustris]